MSLQDVASGTAARLNFPTPIEDVQFSPDGLWLGSEGMDNQGNRDSYLMTFAGGTRTRRTNDAVVDFDPAWRPVQSP
jgi:Tol biopolymer transport system component